MTGKHPPPHFFKILPYQSSFDMPEICVHCGEPSVVENALKTQWINTGEKETTRLALTFPLCRSCGMVMKKFRDSDRKSTLSAVLLALLPAGYFLMVQIRANAEIVPTVLPALIIFGLIHYLLAFILKPMGRLFLKSDDRKKHAAILHSVQITSFDPTNVQFDFIRRDFAEAFESLNRKR